MHLFRYLEIFNMKGFVLLEHRNISRCYDKKLCTI